MQPAVLVQMMASLGETINRWSFLLRSLSIGRFSNLVAVTKSFERAGKKDPVSVAHQHLFTVRRDIQWNVDLTNLHITKFSV